MVLCYQEAVMAYFLKRTPQNNKIYLAIYESFYSHEKKGTVHKSYQALGSLEFHIKNGIADPIAHFQREVDALNEARSNEGVRSEERRGG